MSDRPAPPAQPPAPQRTASGGPTIPPPPPALDKQPPSAAPSGAPSLDKPANGDTAVRPGLAERIQAKLAAAKDGKEPKEPKAPKAPESDVDGAPVVAPTPPKKPRPRGPRRARLRLTRIDPWSVMKTAFLLSIAFGIVTVVSVAMVWQVIDAAGVWTSINDSINEVVTEPGKPAFDIRDYVGTDRVLGFTMLVAAVDVVLITAIATLAAFLYNMSAALLGGIEVTLAEDN